MEKTFDGSFTPTKLEVNFVSFSAPTTVYVIPISRLDQWQVSVREMKQLAAFAAGERASLAAP